MRNIHTKIINKDIEIKMDNINSVTLCKDGTLALGVDGFKVSAERGIQYSIEIVSESECDHSE